MSQTFVSLSDQSPYPVTRGDYSYIVKSAGNTVSLQILDADGVTWNTLNSWTANEVDKLVSLPDGQIQVVLGASTSFQIAPHFTKRL